MLRRAQPLSMLFDRAMFGNSKRINVLQNVAVESAHTRVISRSIRYHNFKPSVEDRLESLEQRLDQADEERSKKEHKWKERKDHIFDHITTAAVVSSLWLVGSTIILNVALMK